MFKLNKNPKSSQTAVISSFMYTPIIVPKKWETKKECVTRSQNIDYASRNSKFEGAFLILAIILVIMFALTIKENDKI